MCVYLFTFLKSRGWKCCYFTKLCIERGSEAILLYHLFTMHTQILLTSCVFNGLEKDAPSKGPVASLKLIIMQQNSLPFTTNGNGYFILQNGSSSLRYDVSMSQYDPHPRFNVSLEGQALHYRRRLKHKLVWPASREVSLEFSSLQSLPDLLYNDWTIFRVVSA